jgi:hypothetical protein
LDVRCWWKANGFCEGLWWVRIRIEPASDI